MKSSPTPRMTSMERIRCSHRGHVAGYTVMMCANIVLRELDGPSYFEEDRLNNMRAAHVRIAEMYKHFGLRMKDQRIPRTSRLIGQNFTIAVGISPRSKLFQSPEAAE